MHINNKNINNKKKHIGVFVWNNFLNDDRVRKKVDSLSKKFNITVHCVCKKPQEKQHITYSKNVEVYFYWWEKSFFKWIFLRTIGNRGFWKNIIYKYNLTYDIVDCNDPDTLWAGVYCKKKNKNTKIIYDSHEYWKGTMRKEYTLLYTLYSYVVNTFQYLREILLVKNADKIICVSYKIKEKLSNHYNKQCVVIMNLATYNKNNNEKLNRICFFGSNPRPGVAGVGRNFKAHGIEPVMIGKILNDKNWLNLGYLTKDNYQKEMSKCKYGLCVFEVTCDNIKYSMPNKFFEYIQAELPVIINKGMESLERTLTKYNVGEVIEINNNKSIDAAIQKLELNYNTYIKNIRKIKYKLCWEAQERKLISAYSDNTRLQGKKHKDKSKSKLYKHFGI